MQEPVEYNIKELHRVAPLKLKKKHYPTLKLMTYH
jgi:hypothetical protein